MIIAVNAEMPGKTVHSGPGRDPEHRSPLYDTVIVRQRAPGATSDLEIR
jgi:hypothetical protein